MHKLAQLQQRIKELNKAGLKKLEEKEYIKAQIIFSQCENILEYAASCGRSIDRELIIAILNNQACVFQQNKQSQKCMDYIEAILFNITSYLQSSEVEQLIKKCNHNIPNNIVSKIPFLHQLKTIIIRKRQSSRYLLLFAQQQKIRSQFRQAINSAMKSRQEMIQSIELSLKYVLLSQRSGSENIVKLLQDLSSQPKQISYKEYNSWVQKFNNIIISNSEGTFQCKFNNFYEEMGNQHKEEIAIYSYQNIFQIRPNKIEEKQDYEGIFSIFQIFMMVLQLSGSLYFFSLALKQMIKLEAPQRNLYLLDSIQLKNVQSKRNMKLASIYEFYSIIIIMEFIGCQSQMLAEIVETYNLNQQKTQQDLQDKQMRDQEKQHQVEQLSRKYENYLIKASPIKQINYLQIKQQLNLNKQEDSKNTTNKLIQFLTPFTSVKNKTEFMFEFPSIESINMQGSSVDPPEKIQQKPQKSILSKDNNNEEQFYPYFMNQVKSYIKTSSSQETNIGNAKIQKNASYTLPQIQQHASEREKIKNKLNKKDKIVSSSKDKNDNALKNKNKVFKKCSQFQKSTKNQSEKSTKKLNEKSIKFNPLQSTKTKASINIYKSQKIPNVTTASFRQLANFNSIKMNKVKSPSRDLKILLRTNRNANQENSKETKSKIKSKSKNKNKDKDKDKDKDRNNSKSKSKSVNKKSSNQQKYKINTCYHKRR